MKYSANVQSGKGRGKGLGFPTYNLVIPNELALAHGIYAAWVWLHGTRYGAAAHFGPVPTFDQAEVTLELYLLDYVDEPGVDALEFELVQFLRPVMTFDTPEALSAQIADDVAKISHILG